MGASDWAGEMVEKLQREYEVDHDRALQIPNRVRQLVANPDVRALKDADLLTEEFTSELVQDLIALLNAQEHETIEGRWNSLVKARGIYDVVGNDALLYDPGHAGLDPDTELVSDDGDTITIQEAMLTAWWDEIRLEAIPHGIRFGTTAFRTRDQTTLARARPDDGFDRDEVTRHLNRDLRHGQLELDADLLALADVEFSMDAPRQDCVLAIAAVRRYILEHGGASRAEILETMEPERTHPLGINGVHASTKGFGHAFRQHWWEDVVAPGLRSLPDLTEPAHESGPWLPTDVVTGGFDSESTVEHILSDGYLFEIAYRDDDDGVRRLVGYRDEITRPSATPLNGPPVFRFRPVAGETPVRIRLPALRELRPIGLDQLPTPVLTPAIAALTTVADENAERIPIEDIEIVLDIFEADQLEPGVALPFVAVAFRERAAVRDAVGDDLEAALRTRSELLTDDAQATGIAKSVAAVAETAPTRVLDVVPAMASAAESASPETRRWLLYAFSNIADAHPEELLPAVPFLIECLEAADENLRTNALSTLGAITQAYPDAAHGLSGSLGDLLTSDDATVRANAVGLLGDLARSRPESVIRLAPELAASLTAADEETRINASITLLRAGEADPDAVRDEHEQLAAALEDPHPTVRANACRLIGSSGAPVPVDELRPLETDPDDRVREQATWALDRIS